MLFFKFQISIRKLKIHDFECLGSQFRSGTVFVSVPMFFDVQKRKLKISLPRISEDLTSKSFRFEFYFVKKYYFLSSQTFSGHILASFLLTEQAS